MSRPLLQTAVIGLGVGEQHAKTYADSPNCHLRWLYDLDVARTEAVRQRLHTGERADSIDTIINDPTVDLVSVASYDDAHYETVIQLLKAKKNVFVEKPLCCSRRELLHIHQTWVENSRPALVSNLVLRGAPIYRWLKSQIEAGVLGDIYAFDGDYLYGRIHKITEEWRKDVPNYSVLEGGGIHLLDLMMGLTEQRPERVRAVGNRIATADTAFRYNDYVAATFEFPSGIVGRLTANFGCVHRHQHVVRIFGTRATFIYDDQGPRLHCTRDPEVSAERIPLATLPKHKGVLIPDVVNSILKNDDHAAQAQREFNLISACIAAEEALLTQQQQKVEYL